MRYLLGSRSVADWDGERLIENTEEDRGQLHMFNGASIQTFRISHTLVMEDERGIVLGLQAWFAPHHGGKSTSFLRDLYHTVGPFLRMGGGIGHIRRLLEFERAYDLVKKEGGYSRD